jgi:hypothetical protein
MKYRYKKLNMVDIDNEQIYLENILNIANYSGQNIKVKNNKIIFISSVNKPSDFGKSDDIYNTLLESYSHFFNTYTYDNIDKNILSDIKKSLKGLEKLGYDNFKIRPVVDYVEIEMINFLSLKTKTEKSKSTYRNDTAYSSDSNCSSDSETMDGDFCLVDAIDKSKSKSKNKNNKESKIYKRKKNQDIKQNENHIEDDNNNKLKKRKKCIDDEKCKSVIIDIKREVPDDISFEEYNISERIQKFLTAATNEICNFCDRHTSSDHNTECENKKESIGSKLKSICNSIKKSFKTISFTNCFSGMSCICCSEIDEEGKHITGEKKSIR